jgi:ketosteroid isomerase-like protein
MGTAESISRSYWDAELARDLDGVMAHYREDSVFEAPGVRLEGPEIRRFYENSFKTFPKHEHEIVRVIGEGNEACIEWRGAMTDHAGRRREFSGVNLVNVDGERFIRLRAYFDRQDLDIAGDAGV